MSRLEFESTIPVNPPSVNRKMKPRVHNRLAEIGPASPYRDPIQLKTFTPVGTAMIIVAAVK